MEIGFPEFATVRAYVVIGMAQDFKESIHRAACEPATGSLDRFFAHT